MHERRSLRTAAFCVRSVGAGRRTGMNIIDTILASVVSSLLVLLPAPHVAPPTAAAPQDVSSEASFVLELRSALERWREDHVLLFAQDASEDSSLQEEDRDRDDSSLKSADAEEAERSPERTHRIGEEVGRGEDTRSASSKEHDEDEYEYEYEEEDEYEDDDRDATPSPRVSAPVAASVPRATPQTTVQAKTFTMADVRTHNSATSCYTVVHGLVYDVSAWITKHPGGQGAIKGMCGVDATGSFDGQHGGSARPESELAQFKIGTLAR